MWKICLKLRGKTVLTAPPHWFRRGRRHRPQGKANVRAARAPVKAPVIRTAETPKTAIWFCPNDLQDYVVSAFSMIFARCPVLDFQVFSIPDVLQFGHIRRSDL